MTAETASPRAPVDLAVAVLTYNNADTITGVVTAAAEGMARHFPDLQGALIAADAGSSDGTPELIEASGVPVVPTRYQPPAGERVSVPFHGVPGRGEGLRAVFSANRLARVCFRDERARALFAGLAGHSILPLSHPLTAALALVFAVIAHVEDWPVAAGGSHAITQALAGLLRELGGAIETGQRVERLAELPPARVVLFDTSPDQLARIAGDALPAGYRRRLSRYRFGPVEWIWRCLAYGRREPLREALP